MTILYILDYGTVGGATKAFISLINQIKKYDVTPIVVTGKRNDLYNLLESLKIQTIAAGHYTALESFSFKSLRWPYRLVKYIIRYYIHEYKALSILESCLDFSQIDLIHTNSARNTLGCRLAKKYCIPHLVHIREFGDRDFNCIKLTPQYIKLLDNYSSCFLSVSKSVQDYWNTKGIDPDKNHLIYDGVNYEDITKSSDKDKTNVKLKMFMAGGVYPTKGQHLAVEAIGYLPIDIRNNVTLDIAGWYSEIYITSMKKYAEDRGYSRQICFLGSINNVHEIIGQYQVGLMCSKSEGFGLVTVEYMHGQLGVIASNSGACPELIEDGNTGLLFKSGDSKDLARCIEMLYNDRSLLIKLSNNAKKDALNRFTASINAEKIYKKYNELINK